MSSTLVTGSSSQLTDTKFSDVIPSVAVIDTPLSKSIALLRPGLILGLLALRFNSLVADPVPTLQLALPAVALVQTVYAIICLPVAGSQSAKIVRKPRPGEKKKADINGPNTISTAILALLLSAIATPAVYILFVLFGAPFLDHVEHTLLCSAHFSLLALFPIFYSRGVKAETLVAVAGASAPLDETFGGLVGAVAGAWLGAVPIPLDWDREWQKWPVTIVVGMFAGSLLCSSVSGTLLFGKRLSSNEEKNE
ncbi:glycosylphosphatidylinositol anchor biosynthesis protein 11 [Metarhizium anisopliae]